MGVGEAAVDVGKASADCPEEASSACANMTDDWRQRATRTVDAISRDLIGVSVPALRFQSGVGRSAMAWMLRVAPGIGLPRLGESGHIPVISGITISRLERGKAPAAAMIKLVLLSDTLGYRFPLGFCPHDHACAWERLDEHGTPLRRRSGMGMGSLFDAMYPGLSDE